MDNLLAKLEKFRLNFCELYNVSNIRELNIAKRAELVEAQKVRKEELAYQGFKMRDRGLIIL